MTWLPLLAAVLLLAGNAFFVGAEFAVMSVRRSQVEPLAESSRRARIVLDALQNLSLMLAGAQLGITLCSLGLGAVAEPAVAHLIEDALHAAHVPDALLHPIAFAIALTIVVFLHMVLGEMVPKNIALATPERAALVLVPALVAFARLVGPLLRLLNAIANGGLRVLHVEPKDELTSSYTPEELAEIIGQSRSEGLLDRDEHERLSSALALQQTCARDVMVTFDRLVTVPETITADELEALVVVTGFSRFPVRSSQDDPGTQEVVEGGLMGFVHVKDILAMSSAARRRPLPAALRRPMPELPADLPLEDVLAALQRNRSHLAQVVDGRGAIGVIALEDVVEQFVGEVEDATHPLNAPLLR
ncbi:MAG TPA: hemolysin family protein [Mycobacteriales bacterium]|jgi:CBS domain containing-hemolysin-like protein|nr:hemolysin family protein [Mycobacteriales bacterium]